MVTFIFGRPGSGKTYYSVNYMLENISEGKEIYTNIKLLDNVVLSGYNYLSPNDMDNIVSKCSKLLGGSELTQLNEAVDELKTIFKEGAIYIIDECHLYGFGTRQKNSGMLELLSIHRNLNIDITLITQTHRQIAPAYLDNGELFVKCIPASNRKFANLLEYRIYTDFEEYKARHGVTAYSYTIKANPNIYNMYSIGDNLEGDNSKRIKMYFFISVAVIVPLGAIYFFSNALSRLVPSENNSTATTAPTAPTATTAPTAPTATTAPTAPTATTGNQDTNKSDVHIIRTSPKKAFNFDEAKKVSGSGMVFEDGDKYHYVIYFK